MAGPMEIVGYTCAICSCPAATKQQVQEVLESNRTLPCWHCGQVSWLPVYKSLRATLDQHTPAGWRCEGCGELTPDLNNWKGDDGVYRCPECCGDIATALYDDDVLAIGHAEIQRHGRLMNAIRLLKDEPQQEPEPEYGVREVPSDPFLVAALKERNRLAQRLQAVETLIGMIDPESSAGADHDYGLPTGAGESGSD